MNPEENFEQALARDIAAAPRHDPTATWKADILARALPKPQAKIVTFPRLMLSAWAACWAVALALQFLTPHEGLPPSLTHSRPRPSSTPENDWRVLEDRRDAMKRLLASNESSHLIRP
jgi:hypothetical protein